MDERGTPDHKEANEIHTENDSFIPTPPMPYPTVDPSIDLHDRDNMLDEPMELEPILAPSAIDSVSDTADETKSMITNEEETDSSDKEKTDKTKYVAPLKCPYCHKELVVVRFGDGTSAYVHKIPSDDCNLVFGDISEIVEIEQKLRYQNAWAEERASFHEEILCPVCNHRLSPRFNENGFVIYYYHTYEQERAEGFRCHELFNDVQEITETKQNINLQIREKVKEYLRWSNYYRSSPKNDHELVCPYCRHPMFIARDGDQCFIVHDMRQLKSNNAWKDISTLINASPCQAIFSDITDLVQVERIRRKLSDVTLIPLCPLCGDPLEAFITNGELEFHHNSSNHHCSAVYKGNMTSIEQARLALVTMDMEVDPKPEEPDRNSPDYPDELVAWYKETTDKILQEAKEKEASEQAETSAAEKEETNEPDEIIDDWSLEEESKASKPWYKKLFGFHAKK